MPKPRMTYRSEKQAQAACLELQKLFRLQDWEVDVNFVHPAEISGGNAAARIFPYELTKEAIIEIPSPEAAPDADHLQYLVHELQHLHFSTWLRPKKLRNKLFEQALVCNEKAFAELLRACKHKACPK